MFSLCYISILRRLIIRRIDSFLTEKVCVDHVINVLNIDASIHFLFFVFKVINAFLFPLAQAFFHLFRVNERDLA